MQYIITNIYKWGDDVVNIEKLLSASRDNHYKLLTLVGDEEAQKKSIISYLKEKDWKVYDVERVVLDLIEDIPENKISKRIGKKLKEWVKEQGKKIVLYNTSILYSPELKLQGPVEAFRYPMRGEREGIIFINGRLRDNKVIYSTPDKEDHMEVDLSKVIFCRLTEVEFGGVNNEN
jgi:hypothetical protein